MSDIETRMLALRVGVLNAGADAELAKFNPYHGKDGRFTGPGGAHFVSTTNARTTERMRSGQMSGGAGPKESTVDEMKTERRLLQSEMDRKMQDAKGLKRVDRVMNEGGGGYSRHEVTTQQIWDQYAPKIKALDDKIFAAEWTKPVTEQRRAQWNAEVSALVSRKPRYTPADVAGIKQQLGFGQADIARAKQLHGIK